jgi:hypothetical protein
VKFALRVPLHPENNVGSSGMNFKRILPIYQHLTGPEGYSYIGVLLTDFFGN